MSAQCRRIRLLFCSRDLYPLTRPDVSVLFQKELCGRGYRIDWSVTARQHTEQSEAITYNNGTFFVGANPGGNGLMAKVRRSFRRVTHQIQTITAALSAGYDIIQVKDLFFAVIPAVVVAKITGAKFTYWMSYPYVTEYRDRAKDSALFVRLLLRCRALVSEAILRSIVFRHAAHVFVQSEKMRDQFIDMGMSANRLTSVPMGIDADAIPAPSDNIASDRYVMCYLGSLSRLRKPEFMIDVLGLVKRRIPMARLILIGSCDNAPYQEQLQKYIRNQSLDADATITGQLSQLEAWSLVRSSGVCLSPIVPGPLLDVSSPTKLVEYMALGKAVVASTAADQPELIEKSGGGMCVSYDPDEFATAVVMYMQNPTMAAMHGDAGRRYVVENRSYRQISDRVDAVLEGIVGSDG